MREHVRNLIGVDALGDDDLRLGIGIRRKKILRLHRAQARHHFRVKILIRHPIRGLECKLAHCFSSLLSSMTFAMIFLTWDGPLS